VAGVRWLVVYNIGAESGGNPLAGANVWAPANPGVISPDGTGFALVGGAPAGESLLALTPPGGSFSFAYASPQRRFYLADQIVGYRCAGGQLLRFTRTDSGALWFSGTEALQASNVTGCSMQYQTGSTQRAGLVTLRLQLTLEGESIELFQQVHVDNAP
jgi:MSHA biogenesis protein MshO